mmetsp:Transcript_20194/g.49796  ORF Transcript_20194/g.49796 Transcript_20194/m.49796 type:complete len:135 (+) Transcript_20194:779-1183(+)
MLYAEAAPSHNGVFRPRHRPPRPFPPRPAPASIPTPIPSTQAGMLDILLRQFANVITVSVVGMCIMLALRIYRILLLMRRRSLGTTSFFAFDGYFALFVIHNLGSVLYYHLSIAATFRLSDASFYDPRFWRRTA